MKVEKESQNVNNTWLSEREFISCLFGLPKRKLRSDLITTSKYLHEEKVQVIKKLSMLTERGIKRINVWKLTSEKFR